MNTPGTPPPAGGHILRFHSEQPAEAKALFFPKLRTFAEANNWGTAVANQVELILEEWLTNVVSYGFSVDNRIPDPRLSIQIESADQTISICVSDNAPEFDPTARPDPDITRPAEERPPGGLGIFMMKKLAQSVQYERHDGQNHLRITKNLVRQANS